MAKQDGKYFDEHDLSHCTNNKDGEHCGRCAIAVNQDYVEEIVAGAKKEKDTKEVHVEEVAGI